MPHAPTVALLIPIFDDWDAADLLCRDLDRALTGLSEAQVRIYLLDDGSSTAPPPQAFAWPAKGVRSIVSVRLRRNVGHQRAIALGLAYLYDKTGSDAVLVMDGDGEDKPTDAVNLIRGYIGSLTSHLRLAPPPARGLDLPARIRTLSRVSSGPDRHRSSGSATSASYPDTSSAQSSSAANRGATMPRASSRRGYR